MLDGEDAVHGLEALLAAAAPEMVVEMGAPSMVQHLGHVQVGTMLCFCLRYLAKSGLHLWGSKYMGL